MTTASMTRLLNNARSRLIGALDPAIKNELFGALNEFFQGSNVWTNDVPIAVTSAASSYEVDPSDPGQINRLMWVLDTNQAPVNATMQIPGTLDLANTPSQNDTYTVTIALTVNDPVASTGLPWCPDWTVDKYNDVMLDGVLARMMSQAAKPYSNERMAIYHMRRFQGGISTAKNEAWHKNVRAGQRWRFPQGWAATRRR
jgi:hypothetical protein